MRRLFLASAALLFLAAAAPASSPDPAPRAGPEPRKASVAVLYFDNQANDPELKVLRKGLTQMLISDLVSAGGFTVVERERLEEVLDELKLQQSTKFDQATACKIGKMVGASYLVAGTYIQIGSAMNLNARVIELERNVVVRSMQRNGKPEDFGNLEQQIAGDFAPFLAALVPPAPAPASKPTGAADPAAAPKPKASPPKLALQTVVKYSKALDAKDRKDLPAARAELEAVVKEQPTFALAAQDLAALMR